MRSKVDEIKFLRAVSFKRPTTSNFLAELRSSKRPNKSPIKTIKIPTGIETQAFSEPQTFTQTPSYIKSFNQFSPNLSKIRLNTPFCISRTQGKTYEDRSLASFPYPANEFLEVYKNLISRYEAAEVFDHPTVFYWGKNSEKNGQMFNFYRFDDDKGNYLCGENDHIAFRYQIIKLIGKGNYGQVFECFDHKENQSIALKIIKNKPKFHAQAHVEIKILRLLKDNDGSDVNNVLKIKEYFIFRNHICIATELLGCSLYDSLKSTNFQGYPENSLRKMAFQILKGLKYLKKLKIIHCDLKPENLLFTNEESRSVKIIDFGTSCHSNERLFSYIQSRYYRAPEVILGISIDCSIDMWSFGCLLFELYTGHVLFEASSEKELIQKIVKFKGPIPPDLLEISPKKAEIIEYLSESADLDKDISDGFEKWNQSDNTLKELCAKCLEWDSRKRITPEEAMLHPWIRAISLQTSNLPGKFQRISKKRMLIISCL